MLHQQLVHIRRLLCQVDSLFILLIFVVYLIIFTQFNLQLIKAHLLLLLVLLRIPANYFSVSATISAATCGIVSPCNGGGCTVDTTSYSNGASFLFTQFYGTVSGTIFSEQSFLRSNPNYYIYAINVKCGTLIDGIQLQFQNSINNNIITDSLYGGSGGGLQTFYVPAGQFITSIYICYGTYVYQLLFRTNLGTQSPYYGAYAGTCTTVYLGRPGLLGIAGYYGQFLNLLQFIS